MKYDGTVNPETMAFVLDWLYELAKTERCDAIEKKWEPTYSASCAARAGAFESCAEKLKQAIEHDRAVQAERERTTEA